MSCLIHIPNIGDISDKSGFKLREQTSNKEFSVGKNGVTGIAATGDGKVEFICFGEEKSLAYVGSGMGYPAYYPVFPVQMKKPLRAVLMDLDGTSVHSEAFWIWIIEMTTASLLKNPKFQLEEADIPYVSGHSVSEHLSYCIRKYCPEKKVEEARGYYFQHTHHEMNEIMEGRGKPNAFTPTPGIREFLYKLKEHKIKIGLVTSGLYEKAWPEILDAFKTLDMGDPKDFYDAIITAGYPLRKGSPGTLGELSPKPHPWLYAETSRVGLGIEFQDRNSVVGIEDSGAGVCSVRLAGFPTIGIGGGNIIDSGTKELCCHYHENFDEIANTIL
ncbi:MAG: HAD family phosphatase [Kiritimatiellaceae bacterium]|nr:HAD family phosphatase [Kiritimatiellaceae bacterium]